MYGSCRSGFSMYKVHPVWSSQKRVLYVQYCRGSGFSIYSISIFSIVTEVASSNVLRMMPDTLIMTCPCDEHGPQIFGVLFIALLYFKLKMKYVFEGTN